MMAIGRVKIGDICSVAFDVGKKYFQYIAQDQLQLNSHVVRCFNKTYALNDSPSLAEIVNGEVEFYAHCIVTLGIKTGCWEKVGNISNTGSLDIYFRGTSDYGRKIGEPIVEVSDKWYVWKLGDLTHSRVGKLEGLATQAEIGLVFTPQDIVYRIRNGAFPLNFYPK